MLIPVFLLVLGLIFSIWLALKRWSTNKKKTKQEAQETAKK
jgi:cytochrome c-type biogenesis protein CcmH/NrfF